MDWHEISALYVQIELMLIASLMRNLTKHEDWEQDKGFAWPAWQAIKLREMEQYRRQNRQLMQPYQTVIHDETAKEIKRQLAEGYGSSGDPQFFRGNRRYLDSLTHDMLHIEQKAERAALRMMDDVYRQTLSRAQLAMAAGASSLQQAVDMATRDFLAQGINCIVYKDGSRHNIADYVQMALRTTAIRAYLQGEALKRAELGIDTVLVSQYGACSKTCLPWQGRVYIDDVWGDFKGERRGDSGRSVNGRWYPLLSVAVRGGLFHPNCRHTLSTWQEGVSTLPEPLDPEKIRETAALEQRQRALERRVRGLKRLAEGTLDPVQQAAYKKQVRAAQADLRAFVGEHDDVLRRSYWREKTYGVPEVEKSLKSGIIYTGRDAMEIQIDKLTPCLIQANTGAIVQTGFKQVKQSELKGLKNKGWLFNWNDKELARDEIYKLVIDGDDEIQGLIAIRYEEHSSAVYAHIAESAPHNRGKNKKYQGVGGHLFAIAALKSLERGYGGFVFLDAKNAELVEHYRQTLGAQLLGIPHPYRMVIEEDVAQRLIKRYNLQTGG